MRTTVLPLPEHVVGSDWLSFSPSDHSVSVPFRRGDFTACGVPLLAQTLVPIQQFIIVTSKVMSRFNYLLDGL